MKWRLSKIESTSEGFTRLAALAEKCKGLFADTVIIDLGRCTFFDANMSAPLGAVLTKATDNLNKIEFEEVSEETERILRKNRFLVSFGFPPLRDTHQTTLPYLRLRPAEEGRFADYLELHLPGKGLPAMSPALRKAFMQSIFEVFHNSVIHAQSKLGVFVCGQFFPRKKRLDITISDAGVGIRTNVRRHLGGRVSSVEAIRWALQEGNTTKTGQSPGGIGLKLLKDFVTRNEGRIQIASRAGFYEFHKGKERFLTMDVDLPGTTVNLEVNTADPHDYDLGAELSQEDIF